MYFGFVEAFHLDIVLACIIHIAQRDKISATKSAITYIAIVIVAILWLFLTGTYIFMAYTVERITKSYRKHVVLKVSEMKDEKYRFWLEDKKVSGNVFQRHFNLMCLFKDIFNTVVLYTLYYKSLALVILITLFQVVFSILAFTYPPFLVGWNNHLLKANMLLYFILDIMFLANIAGGDRISPENRYYVIGFMMIAVVLLIVLLNVGVPLYFNFKDLIRKCKKKKAKKAPEEEVKGDISSLKELAGDNAKNKIWPEEKIQTKMIGDPQPFMDLPEDNISSKGGQTRPSPLSLPMPAKPKKIKGLGLPTRRNRTGKKKKFGNNEVDLNI